MKISGCSNEGSKSPTCKVVRVLRLDGYNLVFWRNGNSFPAYCYEERFGRKVLIIKTEEGEEH